MKRIIKQLLRESINEISLNQDIQHNFEIESDGQGNAYILGDDGQGNDLDMIMKKLNNESTYEFSFSFNQAMVQDVKSTARHYLQVLGIVKQGFEQLFTSVKPNIVILKPTDKDGKEGQKLNIYNNLLKQSSGELNRMGYSISNENGSIIITKNKEINQLSESFNYEVEHLDSYGGQNNYELGLYLDGEIVGLVQYTIFEDKLQVSDILVRPEYRRQGIGSRMMQYIKQQNPTATYEPSMKTDLGAKFKHKTIPDLNK
jgi:GNAT superfamily N-acetyltransferase